MNTVISTDKKKRIFLKVEITPEISKQLLKKANNELTTISTVTRQILDNYFKTQKKS